MGYLLKKETKVDSIHSGLKFGFSKEKSGNIDTVSLEPKTYDVYMPNKHLNISSKKNVYEFLWEVLEHIK